jgi:hypothetical protein
VRWVEPGRRRRRRLPLLPFAILILLLAAGGAVAYVLHDRAQQHAELRDTAVRFARAWEQRKPAAMYRELDADARSKYTRPALRRRLPRGRGGRDRAQGHRLPDRAGEGRAGADGGRGADEAVRHAARAHGAAGDARGRARRVCAGGPTCGCPACAPASA